MPRHCTICDHPERGAIDHALIGSEPFRRIATQFSLSEASVRRHKRDHVAASMAKAEEAKEVAQADSLLDRLLALSRETTAILREARKGDEKDNELALKAIARAEKQIELQARLLGELKDGQTVNVLVMPEWHAVRTAIVHALTPFPQARVAVAEALRRIGDGYSA